MPVAVTPVYAGLLTLLYLALSLRVIGRRHALRVALGDGGDEVLMRRQRAHANFVEYAPLGLVLLALAELNGVAAWGLHAIGAALLAGRALHGYGISRTPERLAFRSAGMVLTFGALLAAAAVNLALAWA